MIKTKLQFLLAFLVITLFVLLTSQCTSGDKPFFIVQLTDPQFGFFDQNRGFDKETVLYLKAVYEINRIKPEFVVITGDFVNNGQDSSQWAEFDRITALINPLIPVYLTPGNHDIGQNPSKARIDAYKAKYGDDKFSIEYKKNRFIGFNSCIIKADTPEMEQEQFVWLERELMKADKEQNIILFCHHPFFIKNHDETETYSNIALEKRERYLNLFEKYNVNSFYAGHYHNNAYGSYKDIHFITTNAIGKPLGAAPPGMRIIVFNSSGVSSVFFDVYEVPEVIDLEIQGQNQD